MINQEEYNLSASASSKTHDTITIQCNNRKMLHKMISSDLFTDVTLVSDDKKKIKAHRNILSASSSVLNDILKIEAHSSKSVIYLKGIQFSEIESLLQFIYLGQTSLDPHKLSEFLSLANNLEIKDLELSNEREEKEDNKKLQKDVEHLDYLGPTIHNDDSSSDDLGQETVSERLVLLQPRQENPTHMPPQPRHNVEIRNSFSLTNNTKECQNDMSRIKNFQCSQCDKSYSDPTAFKRHKQSIHDGITYPCSQCNFYTPDKDVLQIHIKSIHTGMGVRYECAHCGRKYKDKKRWKDHMKSKCSENFSVGNEQTVSLENRTLLESTQEPMPSPEPRHNITEKDQAAPVQSISNTNDETGTGQDHTDHAQATFQCLQCEKSFKRKDTLRLHTQSIHDGITYQCRKCNYYATQKERLKRHDEVVHVGRRYECPDCGIMFKYKDDLSKHMKSISCNGQKPMVVVDNNFVSSNKTSSTNIEEGQDNAGHVLTDYGGSERDETLHQIQEPMTLQAMQAKIETVPLTIESLFSSQIQ